jgi:hypothetical protein
MAVNLIGILEQLLGSSDMLSRIGSLIGLSPDRTKTAIGGAVPAILAALVGQVQKPEGRDQLAATLRKQDPGLLDNLGDMLSGGREKALIDSGSSALTSLFGQSKVDGLAGALGKFAGLDQSSSTSLLGALAPVVLGVLGREQRTEGLDGQGVARMLNDQKDSIARALPSGLASELGSTGLLSGVADRLGDTVRPVSQAARATAADAGRAATTAASTAHQRTSGGGSALRWIIAGLVALAAIWAAYHYLFRGEVREAERPTDTATQVSPAENLMVGDVNVGEEATSLFERATTALNGITDAASAEAALPELTEVNAGLDELGGLAGQLPAAGKTALAALINGSLPDLEALIAKVSDLPGVGAVIKSAADAMVAKLKAMAA